MHVKTLGLVLLGGLLFSQCSKEHWGKGTAPDFAFDTTTSIQIDRSQKRQTIDGFGFFGAQAAWWSAPADLFSDSWADQVINDLGITIWRNEYYPPATPNAGQDADWQKQKPVVEGLAKVARAAEVPLKFVFTVWSPPATMKCAVDSNNQPISGVPNPSGTKNGGTLDPAKYNDFGNWLADGIQLYKNSGIDVYAISPQNEPLFVEPYNSCYYYPIGGYAKMLKNVIPVVKARFPDIKIFGAENMLEIEAGKDRQWFYNTSIMQDPDALKNLDIWAMHGYQEGVSPTASSQLEGLWNVFRSEVSSPSQKPVWMTETSGYVDNWTPVHGEPGAIGLASDILSALYYGQASAWIWWQGSDNSINDFSLMSGSQKGKKYYVSKQFYRFIRPGAQMVKLSFNREDQVFAAAFENTRMKSFTIVLINSSEKKVKVNLSGAKLPHTYDYYYTTADTTENCKKLDKPVGIDNIVLPPSSVVTLVNGNVFEKGIKHGS